MDVYFVLNGITFVWNDDKAQLNPVKHDGITFQQAAEAFFDPLLGAFCINPRKGTFQIETVKTQY